MAVARFQHQTLQPFIARQRLDPLDDLGADLLSTMRRPRVHALDLADSGIVALQCAAADGKAAVTGDEDSRVVVGHLLDGHVVAVLRRCQFEQRGVEFLDQPAHIVLQRRLDGDIDCHRPATPRPSAPGRNSLR